DLGRAAAEFRRSLLTQLRPEQGGFVLQPLREEALQASANGVDCGEYFLGFSSFLIAAALLLVGLLFRLNLDRRASEIGLLLATGFRRSEVAGLLLAEAGVLAILGSLAGIVVGICYAALLLRLLGWLWPGGELQSLLMLT